MSRSDEDVKESEAEPTETAEKPAGGRNKVLLASVAAVVVLVVAGVVVYLLTRDDDSPENAAQGKDVPTISGSAAPTTPGETTPGASVAPPATATGATGAPEEAEAAGTVAEQAAAAISSADVNALNAMSCDPSNPATEDTFPADAKARVVGEPKITGDTATIDLELTIANSEPAVVPMPLTKKDGRWCIPS